MKDAVAITLSLVVGQRVAIGVFGARGLLAIPVAVVVVLVREFARMYRLEVLGPEMVEAQPAVEAEKARVREALRAQDWFGADADVSVN